MSHCTIVCDCIGARTDHWNCTSWFSDGKSCDDTTDNTNTTLVKELCLTSCDYCPSDPCKIGDKAGNTSDYSLLQSKLYFLLLD